jgi:hypothetical protein
MILPPELVKISGGWIVKTAAGYQVQVRPQYLFRLVEVPVDDLRAIGRFWCYATFEGAVLEGIAWEVDPDTAPVGFIKSGGARSA